MKLELAVGRKSVFSVEYGEIKGVNETCGRFHNSVISVMGV